jgi:opacity protein-like surface antigen
MIYGTGGMAFAHVKDTLSNSENILYGDDCGFLPGAFLNGSGSFNDACDTTVAMARSFTASNSQTMLGWTIGAGLDYKWQIDNGSAVIFGIKYLHYEFPTQTFTFTDPRNGLSASFDSSARVDAVLGRISYFFSIH